MNKTGTKLIRMIDGEWSPATSATAATVAARE